MLLPHENTALLYYCIQELSSVARELRKPNPKSQEASTSKLTIKQPRICHSKSVPLRFPRAKCVPRTAGLSCSSLTHTPDYKAHPRKSVRLVSWLPGLIPNTHSVLKVQGCSHLSREKLGFRFNRGSFALLTACNLLLGCFKLGSASSKKDMSLSS